MTESAKRCFHCGDILTGYPFVCKLCGEAHCGKHRLPEMHDCINVGVYRSTSYRKTQARKNKEMKMVKSSGTYAPDANPRNYLSTSSASNFSQGRSTLRFNGAIFGEQTIHFLANPNTSAFVGGSIFGLASVISLIIESLLSLNTLSFLVGVLMVLSSGIGFVLLYQLRKNTAQQHDISTAFGIWYPVGVIITLVTAILPLFTFYLFGFFHDQGGNQRGRAMTGLVGILGSFGIWALGRFVLPLVITLIGPAGIFSVLLTFIAITFQFFLWWGIINLIPWGILDGKKVLDYNSQYYIILLIFGIICYFIGID